MSQEEIQNIDPQIRARAENQWNDGSGLYGDAGNVWWHATTFVQGGAFQKLEPRESYETYIRRKESPAVADYIMKISRPESVVAFDQLAEEFNSDLERMIREKDAKAVYTFVAKASKLIRNNVPDWLTRETGIS